MTTIATLSLNINVTPTNYKQVLEKVEHLFDSGAVFSVQVNEPTEPAPPPANCDTPKAGRRRKAAEPAPEAAPEPPPDDMPQPETVETVEVWDEPAAAPLTMAYMTDKLNAFAKIHGVASTRKTIQSFGVTRLSELEQARWPELLAKLQAENGGKPV